MVNNEALLRAHFMGPRIPCTYFARISTVDSHVAEYTQSSSSHRICSYIAVLGTAEVGRAEVKPTTASFLQHQRSLPQFRLQYRRQREPSFQISSPPLLVALAQHASGYAAGGRLRGRPVQGTSSRTSIQLALQSYTSTHPPRTCHHTATHQERFLTPSLLARLIHADLRIVAANPLLSIQRNIPTRGPKPVYYTLAALAVMAYGWRQLFLGNREQLELGREKMWSRIHLIPLLQAEEDRDQVRRYYADLQREKELLGSETRVMNSDKCVPSLPCVLVL